jgi:hypothetical protein
LSAFAGIFAVPPARPTAVPGLRGSSAPLSRTSPSPNSPARARPPNSAGRNNPRPRSAPYAAPSGAGRNACKEVYPSPALLGPAFSSTQALALRDEAQENGAAAPRMPPLLAALSVWAARQGPAEGHHEACWPE